MASNTHAHRHVIGAMTGTSIDGIDIALVRITGTGLLLHAELIAHTARPLGNLGNALRQLANGKLISAEHIAHTAWAFGKLHANAIHAMLAEDSCTEPLNLIAVHGQTVYHQPPTSWQLINPAPIAERFGCPIVFDLRQADLAAGGQGAPITPLADWIMFRHATRRRAIVNLGGFCNVTILPAAPPSPPSESDDDALRDIQGFDLCACNHLLDAIARQTLGQPYDDGGRAALAGRVDDERASELLGILHEQQTSQRSLGTGDECAEWLERHHAALSGPDLAASAIRAIVHCIGDRLRTADIEEVIIAGGGAYNEALVNTIREHSTAPTTLSDHLGIPVTAREATAMAVLGALCADRVPITLPHITGCRATAPIAGIWVQP